MHRSEASLPTGPRARRGWHTVVGRADQSPREGCEDGLAAVSAHALLRSRQGMARRLAQNRRVDQRMPIGCALPREATDRWLDTRRPVR